MVGIRILHICEEHLAQLFPVEDVDTHGSEVALRVFRFLFEFNDAPGLICIHDAEAARLFHRHFDDSDRCVRLALLVVCEHFCIIHFIDMVAGKDQEIFR